MRTVQVVQASKAAEAEVLNWGLPKRMDGSCVITQHKITADVAVLSSA